MPSAASLGLLAQIFFQVTAPDAGAWPDILSSAGFHRGEPAAITVLREGASGGGWRDRARDGGILVLEGVSDVAAEFGFTPGAKRVRIQSIKESHSPKLHVVWESAVEAPVFRVPAEARVFTRERWEGAPLVAGMRYGKGAVLWVATSPGARASERYPYLLHALRDLGVEPPFRSRRLWAFFDSSYRLRADPDYLARRWRSAGIAGLHVAGWHYFDADPGRDEFLRRLIAACHRNAILVYAWLELPHVGESFWERHPEWREKTAIGQDAHLDWRKLMNLANPECFRETVRGVGGLVNRFDWDGVNLAELYFESLEGVSNPARFTPMNGDVRREFQSAHGFDPIELFEPGKPADAAKLRVFLDWRAALARRLQIAWIQELETLREGRPGLDVVVTHIDDRFDTGMRDALGADAAALLPQMDRHDFTFLIEDPATVWHLGAERYTEIAKRYEPLTRHAARLAIDLNIVERYQDVYPTRQQTGTELFQLVRAASLAFSRVALYFENSILPADVPLLAASAAAVTGVARIGDGLAVRSRQDVWVAWSGPVAIDGRPWPAMGDGGVLVPAGDHVLAPAAEQTAVRLLDFTGELKSARAVPGGLELAYRSSAKAIAVLNMAITSLEIDEEPASAEVIESGNGRTVLLLPRGQHLIRLRVKINAP
ncbi:MAG TPA: hypothetical protein VN428_00080 [Bryobacteraceae bacterium]|nr:hypothetical protein [Bryobacteraceae bacterium]